MSKSTSPGHNRGVAAWRAIAATAAVAIALSSCSSDSKGDSVTADTTLAAPTSVLSGGTVAGSIADMRFSVVQAVVGNALGSGLTMDEDCVAGVVAKLSDADLTLLAGALAKHDGSQPTLSAEGDALASELNACVGTASTDVTGASGGGDTEDVCALVDPAVLAPINSGLGAGTNQQVIGVYGTGNACEFDGDAGTRVTVTITRHADVAAWESEINDADGVGDGRPLSGIGDAAAYGVGFADAIVGDVLVEVSYFPVFDVSYAAQVQALTDVVNGLSL